MPSSPEYWAAWLIIAPLTAALFATLLPRRAHLFAVAGALVTLTLAAGAAAAVMTTGPLPLELGGWGAPLGIRLVLDGLSATMLIMTAVIGLPVSLYALGYIERGSKFWALWLWLWTAMNALYLSGDLFNLYVTLELVGLASVALVALAGGAAAIGAAMRYLLVSLAGSLAYLLGVMLLYAGHGVLDLGLLGARVAPGPAAWLAAALMTAGLLMKTALFPTHVWLAPAHAGAPAPVSAVLSALVVKASFYLVLRLWLEVFPQLMVPAIGVFFGVLGAAAILWGSLQALRASRLKQVVAWSTVAQLGYLFLAFPLAWAIPGGWRVAVFFALAHGSAKAAVFLAAGTLQKTAGHDRLASLGAVLRGRPLTTFALAIAGASLIGLPFSGGFIAKLMLVRVALENQLWGWALLVLAGGLLAGAYVFRVLGRAFMFGPADRGNGVAPVMEWSALGLALVSVALGFAGTPALALLAQSGGAA
jgi:multicomponent Na+:H+ antiporter subunit D